MKTENCKIENCDSVLAFILGREQKIALAEIEAVLRRFGFCFCSGSQCAEHGTTPCYSIISLQDNIALIKIKKAFSDQLSAVSLMKQLGGTIKIFQIANFNPQNNDIESSIVDLLAESSKLTAESSHKGTLNFGISDYSKTYSIKQLQEMGIKIKIKARKKRPVRFVAGKETELSSATSWHKIWRSGGVEVGLFKATDKMRETIRQLADKQIPNSNSRTDCHSGLDPEPHNRVSGSRNREGNLSIQQSNNELLIGRLVATSNPDEWSERDYGKPAVDKYSGMMPPKLARMMINIALGEIASTKYEARDTKRIQNSNFESPEIVSPPDGKPAILDSGFRSSNLRPLIVDPFCGSGNVLMEAMLLGCDVMGSDISDKAIQDTKTNLDWLTNKIQDTPLRSSSYEGQARYKQIPSNKSQINCHSELGSESQNHVSSSTDKEINNGSIKQWSDEAVFIADATSADFIRELESRITLKQENAETEEQKNQGAENQRNIAIVTEPYLGKPKKVKVEKEKAKAEIEDLKNLYLSFFQNLKLAAGIWQLEAIVFVFPLIETSDSGTISLYDECIDDIHKMGYNPIRTLKYGRDYQIVKRQIAVFNP